MSAESTVVWRSPTTCWERGSAEVILPVEAESMPVALFQQAHVGLAITEVDREHLTARSADGARAMSEHTVLEHLRQHLAGKQSERRTDVVPVLGHSGAGKSHLVRWLRNELDRDPLDDVRVVFIPKHKTSLRGVVELVLGAFSDVEELGPLTDKLREATDVASSRDALRTKMRDALCQGIEHDASRSVVAADETDARDEISRTLPALLRDAHFHEVFLGDDSAIARLVDEKLEGRAGDDAVEIAFRFTKEDLKASQDDLNRAGATAQEATQLLVGDFPTNGVDGRTVTELAATMLNDQLPSSLREVFGVGGDDLKELLTQARGFLAGREDIVLLVEDFAMFQGLQEGLIDAIVLHSTETETLCALVTVFAVTDGYYRDHMSETLKTRVSRAFFVGAQPDDAPDRFAASYLRAVRLGLPEVMSRHAADDRGASSCSGCPVVSECHEAFGAVEEEGLFPFSTVMLKRASQGVMKSGFNARRFLADVLRPVLVDDHRSIERGEYPTAATASRFEASEHNPGGSALLAARTRDDGDRRAALALLYKEPVDSGDLSSAVHAAFQLAPTGLTGGGAPSAAVALTTGPSAPVARMPATTGSVETTKVAAVPALVRAIDGWQRSGELKQADRREVRKLVMGAVVDLVPFNDGAFQFGAWTERPAPWIDTQRSVVIDGNVEKSMDGIRLDVSFDDGLDVDAISTLARFAAAKSWAKVEDGAARSARLRVWLLAHADSVAEQLSLNDSDEALLSLAAEALECMHALSGRVATDLPARAEMMVVDPFAVDATDGEGAVEPQVSLQLRNATKLLAGRLQRGVAYARGTTGGIAALDVRVIRRLLQGGDEGRRIVAYAGVQPRPGASLKSIEQALAVVSAELRRVYEGEAALRAALPDPGVIGVDEPRSISDELERIAAGRVAQRLLQSVADAADAVEGGDVEVVREVQGRLDAWGGESPLRRAEIVGSPWRGPAGRLARFIAAAEGVLQAATPPDVDLADRDDDKIVQSWATAVQGVQAAVAMAKEVTS